MSFSKWIGAALGWSFGGPIGAIIGMALGSFVDNATDNKGPLIGERQTGRSRQRTRQSHPYNRPQKRPRTQSGDFEVSLLILASIIIKADGKQDQRELDFVRQQFTNMYGKERANHAFELFKRVSKQNVSMRQVCMQIKQMMDHASRLQLLHFLFGIAKADGIVTEDELRQIYTMSGYLGINNRDYESIKAMFYSSINNAYKVLEIDKSVSDDEVKKAYRKMAKKYHPDRLGHLGEEHQEGAEAKFRQVQEAYEHIQKERGFK
ncbi:TerB family tellurite resistance protein [Winogradskyella immobilis]|uniref:TerB family tellurite resistance protein n=1 Tax=Winogradskyella immobilis TaxID=2816852 RepID=A0ABS8EPQ3_9FLAO|nr:TerB family tellurite resistance protein [Winogradskyella immobilis]MCC1485213.1 TerB family tellurite resistance protein [Winogradskyella immobilis]MCG0017305.1 TerB family tellurite resistance protein [Winogradskyella immobilis]